MSIDLSRRGFLAGISSGLICAPAIVRASSLMQIRAIESVDWAALENLDQYAPGQLYAELQEITRKAFMPRLFVQLWKQTPSLAAYLDQQVSANA
jgi:hypothetical protein